MTTSQAPKTLSIDEAAQRTGLTAKALRSRIDRGTLRSVKDEYGKRRILTRDLQRAGLLDLDGVSTGAASESQLRRANSAGVDVAALIDRVIDAEIRASEAKQLAEFAGMNAEQDQQRIKELELQVFELNAALQVSIASTQRRRFLRRKKREV